MSSIELSGLDKEVLARGTLLWNQKVVNYAKKILETCNTDEKIGMLFEEFEKNIRNPEYCRITWNTQVHAFDGAECGHVCFFRSEVLDAVIKAAIKIDAVEDIIHVGNVLIADGREESKFQKHIKNET